ncbi:ABC-F family ATP-binding cassette domain-containing protein [Rhizobium leguminosarum]|uniref:ABC-F family ATP-binding cassette domain-containing protein n=1 Tax=Rhizobium leguminosarum TaxID=384 RepID=UPI001C95AC4C|nr:ABC-F family ATP-binding cassette domain-containing protein [Rhizobium leguminosarum]MBY5662109.1 ABC-F family ATP-binding cassette domain-containing protein [Rhizobium leguminosarum]MBY5675270.1 ABC-F family ATP-binding cassette domain-containing protein [Rhizobium leguminosarum]MBY5688882.1 ABC-F family ATP-binding cassette domain-containing protein [Rhizobium leguminosarum]MBY5722815.1 ABC-F family ATP-binding cassette domain-containing protein [Rhizobium leguminosarum]MBY5744041.1 ABC-F
MITLTDISARIAGRLLLDNASVSLPSGTKAGLVGRNGAGKSTLFRVITGDLGSESGTVSIPKAARIGQVAQEAPATEDALIEIVLAADKERTALVAEAETATDPHRIAEIQMRLVDIDAHSAEARAASILAGLGFDKDAQARPASSFSGGWRMRVALAAVLFSEPDLLLLDEPTNYLDLEGTLWLEDYVRRYPHTVIIISHDRDLLNNAVNAIVHLDQKKLTFYRGGYDQFERQKAEADELQTKAKAKNDAARKHLQGFIDRFKAKASKARQAQSRVKALERMGTVAAVIEDHVQPITFPEPEKQPASPIVAIQSGAVGYEPGNPILKNLNLRIDNDDRIALLGSNGNGKSTFAKFISGRLAPESGEVKIAPSLKIGFFAQHQLDDLIPEQSAVEHVRRLMPGAPEAKVRARVAQMGLATEKMATAAKDLSGGEKARLLMGLAAFNAPNLLILDEPTNHLDIDSRRALIEALNDYEGAVILISHDRHLIEATVDRLWLVNGGTVTSFEGDMDEYRDLIVSSGKKKEEKPQLVEDATSKADQRKLNAERRASLTPLRKKINDIESLTAKLEKQIQALDVELADPALYEKTPAKAAEKAKQRGEAAAKLAAAEEDWLMLSAEYEEAMAG